MVVIHVERLGVVQVVELTDCDVQTVLVVVAQQAQTVVVAFSYFVRAVRLKLVCIQQVRLPINYFSWLEQPIASDTSVVAWQRIVRVEACCVFLGYVNIPKLRIQTCTISRLRTGCKFVQSMVTLGQSAEPIKINHLVLTCFAKVAVHRILFSVHVLWLEICVESSWVGFRHKALPLFLEWRLVQAVDVTPFVFTCWVKCTRKWLFKVIRFLGEWLQILQCVKPEMHRSWVGIPNVKFLHFSLLFDFLSQSRDLIDRSYFLLLCLVCHIQKRSELIFKHLILEFHWSLDLFKLTFKCIWKHLKLIVKHLMLHINFTVLNSFQRIVIQCLSLKQRKLLVSQMNIVNCIKVTDLWKLRKFRYRHHLRKLWEIVVVRDHFLCVLHVLELPLHFVQLLFLCI